MSTFDLRLSDLHEYCPAVSRQADFWTFWSQTLDEAKRLPLNAELVAVDYPVDGLRVRKATYTGWGGARICGWYLTPEVADTRPAIVFYPGYSSGKGVVYDYLAWALQGYAVLAIDVRGQGESNDTTVYPGTLVAGWITRGIVDPLRYYYRGVFIDCVRALEFVASQPEVDPDRVGVAGGSGGGGLALAVAALDRRPKVALADVPFLCHFARAVEVTEQRPYGDIAEYCRLYPGREETVFRTLSYFDIVNLAERITCPTLVSVGLRDTSCPPSTVFAAYNHLRCSKEIKVYPYGLHAFFPEHWEEKIRWAREYLQGAKK